MISWKNPDENDRGLGMHDYLQMGVMDAIQAVSDITHARDIHGAGYCLGGTLLAIAAAAMARNDDARLKTVTRKQKGSGLYFCLLFNAPAAAS